MTSPVVDVTPIGGVGQFGMNCLLLRAGDEAAIIDAGLLFPTGDFWGIDAIVPDLTPWLEEGLRVSAIVLTHAHEDHIGGAPWLIERTRCPVYGSDLTLGLLRERLAERGQAGPETSARLRSVVPRERVGAGPFVFEFLHVTHSVPGAFALAIETPAGRIVHSADFKLDPTPVDGPPTDLERLVAIGREGVRLLLLDSTNAAREGTTPSERTVGEAFSRRIGAEKRRVFVTTFSSHVHRVQQLADIAAATGRKLAVVGRRMSSSVRIARETGQLRVPAGLLIGGPEAMDLPAERGLVVAGGSQGEPVSAMRRISRGDHPDIAIGADDLVIHSARAIPGNEAILSRMFDDLARRGAEVLPGEPGGFHVSGHASRDDLRAFIERVRPQVFVPVHGTYRHLLAAIGVAESMSEPPRTILLAENGDIIRLDGPRAAVAGRIEIRRVFLDRAHDLVTEEILRERRRLAEDGMILALVVLDRTTGRLIGDPEIVSRGFAAPAGEDGLFREASRIVAGAVHGPAGNGAAEATLDERIQDVVRRFVRRKTNKRPLVTPVVIRV